MSRSQINRFVNTKLKTLEIDQVFKPSDTNSMNRPLSMCNYRSKFPKKLNDTMSCESLESSNKS